MIVKDVKKLQIQGVKLISYEAFMDERGYFTEPFRESQIQDVIPGFRCVQVNQSQSKPGVIRGLHWQHSPPMGKLVRVLSGLMWDLCLDLRKESPTFGKAIAVLMHADNNQWIWVPPGIAHGNFFPRRTVIEYLCTAEYNKDGEDGICPIDSGIEWITPVPFVPDDVVLSDKDRNAQSFAQWRDR